MFRLCVQSVHFPTDSTDEESCPKPEFSEDEGSLTVKWSESKWFHLSADERAWSSASVRLHGGLGLPLACSCCHFIYFFSISALCGTWTWPAWPPSRTTLTSGTSLVTKKNTTTLFQKRFSASVFFSKKIFPLHAAENIASIENEVIIKMICSLQPFFLLYNKILASLG